MCGASCAISVACVSWVMHFVSVFHVTRCVRKCIELFRRFVVAVDEYRVLIPCVLVRSTWYVGASEKLRSNSRLSAVLLLCQTGVTCMRAMIFHFVAFTEGGRSLQFDIQLECCTVAHRVINSHVLI